MLAGSVDIQLLLHGVKVNIQSEVNMYFDLSEFSYWQYGEIIQIKIQV